MSDKSAPFPGNPRAHPDACICDGTVRITVLTPALLRLEWHPKGDFEDRASLLFINRNLPVPPYSITCDEELLHLSTSKLTLRYKRNSGRFTAENLRITLSCGGHNVHWHPGLQDRGNLGGTVSTLDGISGSVPLEPGLISRSGWVLIDDSERPLLHKKTRQKQAIPWVFSRPSGERQDWYFFGHGHDYPSALRDFTQVAGKIPLIPRYALGLWWSRYWAYTDGELLQLIDEFERHDVPLDVLVIDMDWHQTFGVRWWKPNPDQSGHQLGWSGYTWDKTLFPEPEKFLRELKKRGLRLSLNLHPASGVQPHEQQYPAMAQAMGIDPASGRHVPFDLTDERFARAYFELLHHPLEKAGIDFWWLDWQQGESTKIPGLHPIWWLNHCHFIDMESRDNRRGLLLHRWGGPGNHRYQVGFSGDTISNWKSLAAQPAFTATAANIGYGYWSHDIGGHMPGPVDGELYLRWLQFGVFSPVLRTHTTKNSRAERRIWAFAPEEFHAMRETILLRYRLIPYIYTAARQAYDTGLSICRPMYYSHPETEEAYTFRGQYWFGPDMIVAPVVEPVAPETGLAVKQFWLPQGRWFCWSTGAFFHGPGVFRAAFARDEIPVFVRAGAVIPLQNPAQKAATSFPDPLVLAIFPGEEGCTEVYEDDGLSRDYQRTLASRLPVTFRRRAGRWRVEIGPHRGRFNGMPGQRGFELNVHACLPPEHISCMGRAIPRRSETAPGWHYDGERLLLHIPLLSFSVEEKIIIEWQAQPADPAVHPFADGWPGRLARLRRAAQHLNTLWPQEWSPESLVHGLQTGRRITLNPETAVQEISNLQNNWRTILADIEALQVDDPAVPMRALQHLRAEAECPAAFSRMKWQCMTTSAPAGFGQAAVFFRGKFWLFGGHNEHGCSSAIACSEDGKQWHRSSRSRSAPWPARTHHAVVEFDGRLWLLGGENGDRLFDDCWVSSDGEHWQQVTHSMGTGGVSRFSAFAFSGRLWIVAGRQQSGPGRGVYSTQDGATWQAMPLPPWQPRMGAACTIFEGRIWLSGGVNRFNESYGDLWYSPDGQRWHCLLTHAPWLPRNGHALMTCGRALWLLGGVDHAAYNDVWRSENGVHWQHLDDDAAWPPRCYPAALVQDATIWLFNGSSERLLHERSGHARADVWAADIGQLRM